MSLRREARDYQEAVRISKAAHAASSPETPASAAGGRESFAPADLNRCLDRSYRRDTDRTFKTMPSGIATSRNSSLSPSLLLDMVSTPAHVVSSPPTTVSASAISLASDAVALRDGRSSPRKSVQSPLKEAVRAVSNSRQYVSSASTKRGLAAQLDDSDVENEDIPSGSRTASAGKADSAAYSKHTEIFVDLPESTAKRRKSGTLYLSPEPSGPPANRQGTDRGSEKATTSSPLLSARDRKRTQSAAEAADAALAATLAMQGEGIATRRASRNSSKPVSYAPVCDKDGRPLKNLSSGTSSAATGKHLDKDGNKRHKNVGSTEAEDPQPRRNRDRATRLRDEDETDDEDWQSSHSIDSPARASTPSGRAVEPASKDVAVEARAASSRLQDAVNPVSRTEQEARAVDVTDLTTAYPASATMTALLVEEGSSTRRSKRQSDIQAKKEREKAERRKAREERKRREADELARQEAQTRLQVPSAKKSGRGKSAKSADAAKTFDLTADSPTRASKDYGDKLVHDSTILRSPELEGGSAETVDAAQSPEMSPTGKGRPRSAEILTPPPVEHIASAGAPRQSELHYVDDAAQADVDRDEAASGGESESVSSARHNRTPLFAPEADSCGGPTSSARASTKRALSSAPRSDAAGSQTPKTIAIAHRSATTPASPRPATPGGSAFVGKPLSSLLTPGTSKYGAVRRPGLTRKTKIPSLLSHRGPPPPPRPPAPVKKKKRGDEDDYVFDEAYERLMGRIKDADASDEEDAAAVEASDEERPEADEALEEVLDDY